MTLQPHDPQGRSPGNGPIRVVLADDHDLVRAGIKALLHTIGGVEVVAEARDGQEILTLLETVTADVVMTDISMEGMDGLEATEQIVARFPNVRVIVLSMHEGIDFVKRAIAKGASGYLMKFSRTPELEQALRGVMESGSYFSPEVTQRLLRRSEPTVEDALTFRQMQILTLLAQGKSAKEIGFELGLSSKTVDVHRANIMQRLNLKDTASLTRYAVRKGLVKL